jgi:chlorophyll(ide) b reductase
MSSASCASSRALPLASPLRIRRARRPTTTPRAASGAGVPTSRTDPFKVIITGSTKGLGLELARGFLSRGDRVVVTSRDETRVREAVAALREDFGERVAGVAADVSRPDAVDALTDFASESMGGVDIWINNAGANGYVYENLAESDPEVLREIVLTNSFGTLLCCRSAIRLMATQAEGGHVFNMLGAGSDGGPTQKYAAYGHTKAGMAQLTKTLAGEVKDTGNARVGVHALSPGMVFTELISSGRYAFGSQGRFFVNTLAEPPEVPAAFLVEKVRTFVEEVGAEESAPSDLSDLIRAARNGGGKGVASRTFEVLTPPVALKKILRRVVLGEGKDRYYPEKE